MKITEIINLYESTEYDTLLQNIFKMYTNLKNHSFYDRKVDADDFQSANSFLYAIRANVRQDAKAVSSEYWPQAQKLIHKFLDAYKNSTDSLTKEDVKELADILYQLSMDVKNKHPDYRVYN